MGVCMLAKLIATFSVSCFLLSGEVSAKFQVIPTGETQPAAHRGDSIDDPALWIHPSKPGKSLILGTDKQEGINVYSLNGKLQFSYGEARFNNIDIRYDFPYKGQKINLIAATRHDISQVEFFTLDPKKQKLVALDYKINPTNKAYGLCLYKDDGDKTFHLFVTGRDKNVEQFRIMGNNQGIAHKLERTIRIATKNEGCVADDELGNVYIAEEHRGIWKVNADAEYNAEPSLIGSIADNDELEEDIEGLALYKGPDGEGYLLASIQGLDSFAIFDRKTDRYLDSFKVVGSRGIDGVSHTDGIEVVSSNLGPSYSQGLMIVQDDADRMRSHRGTQNFKLISWKDILEASELPH